MTEELSRAEEAALLETPLHSFARLRDQLQRVRIAEGNRVAAAVKQEDEKKAKLHSEFASRLQELEDDATKLMNREVRTHPAWPWMKQVKGVAETLAALIVSEIDIERCVHPGSLWKYAGMGVTDGQRDRPVKGQKRPYNSRLKGFMGRWMTSQLLVGGPYVKFYRQAKERYELSRPDWTPKHRDNAARRIAQKIFLSHLYEVWRTAVGLPVSPEYIQVYGDGTHTHVGPEEVIAA